MSGEVAGQGVPKKDLNVHVRAHIRYAGTDTALVVKAGSLAAMKSGFEKAHKAQFGFIDRKKDLVIEAVSVEAVGGGAKFREKKGKITRAKLPKPARRTKFFSGKWLDATVFTREQLYQRHKVKGPAIVIEPHQTVVVEPGWQAEVTAKNHLVLRRVVKLKRTTAIGTKADPIMLEVFNNLFMSIAEQMGVALQNTAYSVNIKERLDFSCAVFAHDGTLVANAPHMPVHLGLDGPLGRDDHPRQQGTHQAGRRLRHQRALQRRHAPAGHHGLHAGVRRQEEEHPVLGRLARPPRRRRRHLARLDVAECDHDPRRGRAVRQFQGHRSRPLPREGALRRAARRREISGAQSACRTSTT